MGHVGGSIVDIAAVDVQGECPLNCSAKMSLGYSGIVSDVDAGRLAGDRRVGGFSASM